MCGGQCGGAEFGEELNEKHVVAVKSLFLEGFKTGAGRRGLAQSRESRH